MSNGVIIMISKFNLHLRVLIFIERPTVDNGIAIFSNRYAKSANKELNTLLISRFDRKYQHEKKTSSQNINSRSVEHTSEYTTFNTLTGDEILKKNRSFFIAIKTGNLELIKKLVNEKSWDLKSLDENNNNLLYCAITHGQLEIVKYLINTGDNTSNYLLQKNGETALHIAAKHGHLNIIKYLVIHHLSQGRGSPKDFKNKLKVTPFFIAAENGNTQIMKYWYEKFDHVDVNEISCNKAFHILGNASKKGHLGAVKFLVEHGADVNNKPSIDSVALMHAISNQHLKVVEYLLKNRAKKEDPCMFNFRSPTLLLNVAIKESSISLKRLKNLADHLMYTNTSSPMLHLKVAIRNSSSAFDIFKKILEYTDDNEINSENHDGHTALTLASDTGSIDVIQYLLDKGADVNFTSTTGKAPLDCAIRNGHLEIVKLLLQKGAKAHSTDKDGKTPLDIVKETKPDNYLEIEKLLNEANNNTNHKDDNNL